MSNNHNSPPPSIVVPSRYQTPPLTTTAQTAENLNNLSNTNNQFNRATSASQSLPLTSIGIATSNSEKIYLENDLGEALECTTVNMSCEIRKSLPMALQQRTIE